MIMTRHEAVKNAINESGWTQARWSEILGVSSVQVNRWLNSEKDFNIHISNLERVADIMGKRIKWLNFGKTECEFVEIPKDELIPGQTLPPNPERPDGAIWSPPDLKGKSIPVIGFAAAGSGGFYSDQGYPVGGFEEEITRPYDLKDITAYGLKIPSINGDSMKPFIRRGDIVIASPAATVINKDMVVVRLKDGQVMIKEIRFHGDDVELISYNKTFDTIKVKADDVQFYHKVVHIKKK